MSNRHVVAMFMLQRGRTASEPSQQPDTKTGGNLGIYHIYHALKGTGTYFCALLLGCIGMRALARRRVSERCGGKKER